MLRSERNRKRSKRRAIYCPIHGCYLDSVSQKSSLPANFVAYSQQQRMKVPTESEWLEAFWCDQCLGVTWYHVKKCGSAYLVTYANHDSAHALCPKALINR